MTKLSGTITPIGTFALTSPELRVSDPCYDTTVWCSGSIQNCRTGAWEAAVFLEVYEFWGKRVLALAARHAETGPEFRGIDDIRWGEDGSWQACPFEVGVDSGSAGIFDAAHYREAPTEDDWDDRCYRLTVSENRAGVLPFGVVSISGYGDGGYEAFFHTAPDGLVDFIFILFIEDEPSDED